MKENIAGTLAIDAGVIIELLFQSKAGIAIRNALLEEIIDAHTTEMAITEVKYILCRKFGWEESCCERSISLADCFVLTLAKKLGCKALFARREQEMVKEMNGKKFDVEILFLEDLI